MTGYSGVLRESFRKELRSMTIIKNGIVHDAVNREPYRADIYVENGKIAKIRRPEDSASMQKPESPDTKVIDATGLHVYPGFVEAHCHTGLDGYGIGYEGADYNEMNDIISPQLRGIDGFQPFDPTVSQAREAGVTTICTGPGSANVLGGTFTVVKTVGKRVDDMYIIKEAAMKCAFGENPKRCYRDKCDTTRMSTAAKLREMLFKTKEYDMKIRSAGDDISKLPAFDIKLKSLLPVIRGEMPLKAHAHQADDIFTAIRIAKEFGLKLTLEHVTEGHLIADELASEGYPVAVGPSLTHASKFELRNKSWTTPGILAAAGCRVSIITDAPVIPQNYLPLCAGLAVKAGMDPFDALQAITINPAHHIGAVNRVGSLEEGKDADILIMDGDPFELAAKMKYVMIDGKIC